MIHNGDRGDDDAHDVELAAATGVSGFACYCLLLLRTTASTYFEPLFTSLKSTCLALTGFDLYETKQYRLRSTS